MIDRLESIHGDAQLPQRLEVGALVVRSIARRCLPQRGPYEILEPHRAGEAGQRRRRQRVVRIEGKPAVLEQEPRDKRMSIEVVHERKRHAVDAAGVHAAEPQHFADRPPREAQMHLPTTETLFLDDGRDFSIDQQRCGAVVARVDAENDHPLPSSWGRHGSPSRGGTAHCAAGRPPAAPMAAGGVAGRSTGFRKGDGPGGVKERERAATIAKNMPSSIRGDRG